jgi:hypothetical protein
VRTLSGPAAAGLNRVVWDLKIGSDESSGRGGGGVEVIPGEYRVRVDSGEGSADGILVVLPDPRIAVPHADRVARMEAIEEVRGWVAEVADARERLRRPARRFPGS